MKALHPVRHVIAPRSLRLQLLSRSLLILSAMLLLIGVSQFVLMSHFLYQATASKIRAEVEATQPHLWESFLGGPQTQSDQDEHKETGGGPFFSLNVASIAFINSNYSFRTLDGSPPVLDKKEYLDAFAKRPTMSAYDMARDSSGRVQLLVIVPIQASEDGPRGLIQVGTYIRPTEHVLSELLVVFVALAVSSLLIGLLLFLPILRRTLVPLSNMIDTVQRINAGNLEERVEDNHEQLEIEQLSTAFNAMLDRLETSFDAEREANDRMRRFVADASHELRTPITSIHGFLEVLLRGAAARPDQLQRALKSMYGEAERVTKLVQDLLLLAQLDREPRLVQKDGSITNVIHEMEPQLRLLAGDRHVELNLAPEAYAHFDSDRIKQVILNLFHNAVQHTDPEKGVVRIEVSRENKWLRIAVVDNGPGIPEDKLAKVFERFYRLDSARARSAGGAGLGLAISESIVDRHGGTITCESELGHGATFIVHLPAIDRAPNE